MLNLSFRSGTLEIRGLNPDDESLAPLCQWDERAACHRAPAINYADIVTKLIRTKVEYQDEARQYQELGAGARSLREPRPYQQQALDAWLNKRSRGVVVLPTGAGKTEVAMMAIDRKRRSTLVVAPTLDLVRQWFDRMGETFGVPIGLVGGGERDIQPLTVTTYDSAYMHMEFLGARFGMIVFDECHHLPSGAYSMAAQFALAPFRLGLTATPERTDGGEARLADLVGPTVFRLDINQLSGDYLAEYETVTVVVQLSEEERKEYKEQRAIYTTFVRNNGINFSAPGGWTQFIIASARTADGMRAMAAYRRQKDLALAARSKLDMVRQLLKQHQQDRILLFTQDNATAYQLSRQFLVPVITHQTRVRERSEVLAGFREGRYGVLATSKVLNEGVDVPEANVAIVISGSGSVREHVQRLGRILRKREGKRATLYEIVSEDTAESSISERRRDHIAYR